MARKQLVFVSHAGEDTWVAKQIARHIEKTGAECFLDEADIDIGEEFEGVIRQNLQRADEFLALMPPWAIDRPYIMVEIGAAFVRQIPIVIALQGMSIDEFKAHSKAPIFVQARNIIALNDISRYFGELQERVNRNRSTD